MTRLSYSALGAYARCGYRFYAERVLGLPARRVRGPDRPALAPGRARPAAGSAPRSAADRGVLVHALLQALSLRRPAVPDPEAVRQLARRVGLGPTAR